MCTVSKSGSLGGLEETSHPSGPYIYQRTVLTEAGNGRGEAGIGGHDLPETTSSASSTVRVASSSKVTGRRISMRPGAFNSEEGTECKLTFSLSDLPSILSAIRIEVVF